MSARTLPPVAFGGRLVVRDHLRPKPRKPAPTWQHCCQIAASIGCTAEEVWVDLTMVMVLGQVDRTLHPSGWGYDYLRHIPLAEAEALSWAGEA